MPTIEALRVQQIARVCHEANRAWCVANGDTSQPTWDDAPDWQRESAQLGVRAALKGATPEQSHEGWTRHKLEQGWTYGPVKDPEAKQHPCLVPYDELPEEQRLKDVLFTSIVRALGTRGDGEAGESEPRCLALAPGTYPIGPPQCAKPAGHAGDHQSDDGADEPTGTRWPRGPLG